MKITALAGGVGGAKLAAGLAEALSPGNLSIIGNTGDDFEWQGLYVCPDLDTITYTLAGLANPETGWGIRNDTFECLKQLAALGEDDWFKIGDRDLSTHILRTLMLRSGKRLAEVTRELCARYHIGITIMPMTEDPMPTLIHTDEGTLDFQEYFVRRRCSPAVRGFSFRDSGRATPAPGLLNLIHEADAVIICPSNPFISIGPILAVPRIREALISCGAPVVAVSPIIGGKAVKGPTAEMLRHLNMPVSAAAVAALYRDFVDIFVVDENDGAEAAEIAGLNIECRTAPILMNDAASRNRAAKSLLEMLQ